MSTIKGTLLKEYRGMAAGTEIQVTPTLYKSLVENGFFAEPTQPEALKKKTKTADVIEEKPD